MSFYKKLRLFITIRKKVYQYVKTLGLKNGLSAILKIKYSSESEIIAITLPKLNHPVYLRTSTSDIGVFEEIFVDEIYKNLKVLPNCNTIIDAGANIGLFALYMLTTYPNAHIYCIEPEDSNFILLQKNIAPFSNVQALKNGLWHSNTYLKFEDKSVSKWAFQLIESTATEFDIHGISVQDIIDNFNLQTIDIVKIDIEGSEKEVFQRNVTWLEQTKFLMIETHDDRRKDSAKTVMDALNSYHFKHSYVNSNHFFFK